MLVLKKIYSNVTILICLGIIARIISIFFFGDKIITNEWGDILNNLENKNVFGFREIENFIAPNLFMPPLYPFFLFSLKKIYVFSVGYVEFVLFIQLLVSVIAIYCFIQLSKLFLFGSLNNFAVIIFIFFPLNIYSVSQISSITINVFLIVCFFLNFFLYVKNNKIKNLIYLSIVSGLLMLTRGEFILFYFFTIFYILRINKNLKKIIMSFLITCLILSPYLIRNYLVFETITITKSFGFNLWKGNNEFSKSEGNENIYNKNLEEKILNLNKDYNYDIEIDNLFKEEALKNLKTYPKKYFLSYFKKLFSFFFLDLESTFPNYFNFFHFFPKLILAILSFLGGIKAFRNSENFLFLSYFYFGYGIIFSFFFILPRYSLIVLPVQILLACNFFNDLFLPKPKK